MTREDRDSLVEMLAKIPVTETKGSLLSAIGKLLRVIDISESSIMIPTLLKDKCEFDAYEMLTLAKILKASILGHNDLVEFYMSESSSKSQFPNENLAQQPQLQQQQLQRTQNQQQQQLQQQQTHSLQQQHQLMITGTTTTTAISHNTNANNLSNPNTISNGTPATGHSTGQHAPHTAGARGYRHGSSNTDSSSGGGGGGSGSSSTTNTSSNSSSGHFSQHHGYVMSAASHHNNSNNHHHHHHHLGATHHPIHQLSATPSLRSSSVSDSTSALSTAPSTPMPHLAESIGSAGSGVAGSGRDVNVNVNGKALTSNQLHHRLHMNSNGDPDATVRLLLQIEHLKVFIPHVTGIFESIVELYKNSVDTFTYGNLK